MINSNRLTTQNESGTEPGTVVLHTRLTISTRTKTHRMIVRNASYGKTKSQTILNTNKPRYKCNFQDTL